MKHISRLTAAALAGWAIARLFGVDRVRRFEAPVAPLLSFTPYAAAAAPAIAALQRRRPYAVTAALAGSALALTVLPRTIKRRQPETDGPVLRILSANLLAGQASEDVVVGLLRWTSADVLFVQELTYDAATRLKQAGLNELFPHSIGDARSGGARGWGIYARFALAEGPPVAAIAVGQPMARLHLPTGPPVDLVCVHPHAPTPVRSRWRVARWRKELAALPPPADVPRVLAGDFNATLDHAQFRRLLGLGYADAACQMGHGLVPTWGPEGKPALLAVDHILLDPRCAVLRTSTHVLPGSDHRALFAEIKLPGRTSMSPALP